MQFEVGYRIALALIIVLTTSVTLYHRLQAASSGEPISRRAEGYAFAAVLRAAGLLLWLSTLAYLFYPPTMMWAAVSLPSSLRWSGGAAAVACVGLLYWTLSSLGRNLTDTVVTRQNATLVTHGPYRWVRHPFYVAAALLMASVSLLTANAVIAGASLAVLFLLAVRTPKEEQMLIDRFGDDYRKYIAETGRFVPRFRHSPARPKTSN